ncbi:MAG: division/cell wall cluster transcriptional repressor MraZ [Patescibacteria group bacterium]
MLIGEYTHTLDEKKRVSLPSKFRKEIGKRVVATRGLDNCLFLYEWNEWQKIAQKVSDLGMAQADKRSFNRFLLSSAQELDIDNVGRFLIPEHLKDFAHLKSKIVFAGVGNRVEIWDEENWMKYKKEVEKQADVLAERLGQIGAL